ncbi:metallophosphoesterase [Candidatus Bipolaricaulota bacterium]
MTLSISVPVLEENPLVKTSHVTLENLDPATDYVYRVTLVDEDGESHSPVGAFSTAPDPGKPVSFIVLADTQQQLEGLNRLELVGDAIAADPMEFDFILHAGDVVESPSTYYWDDWFSSFGDMLLRAPFIPVLGNHEKNHRSYYDAFELPPGAGKDDERWWALHWGDVVVVGLDSNVKKATDYTEQQEWARTHLSGPEPHKFVIFHHPVFSSDAYHSTGTFLDKIYHPIFVETEVDIVFNGHSHHYEHIVRDGVTYLVVGGGGATPRRTKPEHIQGSDVSVEGHFFYVRAIAEAEGIRVETVSVAEQRADGTCDESAGDVLLDSFRLEGYEEERRADRPLLWIILAGVAAAAVALILLRASAD